MMVDAPALVEASGISKSFPGVRALDDVSMRLERGEALCIVGENGAGKSTLMKILGGVYATDGGEIRIDGRRVEIGSVDRAQQLGITLIHQELNLAQTLDVAGNLFLGREPRWAGPLKLIDRRIYRDAQAITQRIGLDCSPRALVSHLSIGQQQLVEIGRSLSLSSRVLIMDEPTSSLTQRETERLFAVIRDLKRDGVSIVYISHRLAEVQEIADRVTVLRDGKNAGELSRAEISHEAIIRLMVGRELKQFFHRPATQEQQGARESVPAALEVCGARVSGTERKPIDFTVRGGEIVGMAGLMGAGRTELAEAIFGVRPLRAGQLLVDGRVIRLRSPRDAIKAGIFLIPEDRRHQGLILEQSIRQNISLASLDRLSNLRLVARRRERELAERMRERLNIRTSTIEKLAGLLSGGNQQKIVIARWLARSPRALILDEPTRGIDVGAKAEIYGLMRELARQGVGILMISSDLEEILGVSDRVLVMHQGELAGGLEREALSEQSVMRLATGGGAKA
jgi:ribose transport system ATP-binding protein